MSHVFPAHTGPEGRIYVTCHQCDSCQHIGINDEHPTESACNRGLCGWHGPAPAEDRCPGCGEVGTMSTACPQCGGHYVLLAEADIAPHGVGVGALSSETCVHNDEERFCPICQRHAQQLTAGVPEIEGGAQ